MKNMKRIRILIVKVICILFSAGLANAHSDHDNTFYLQLIDKHR